MAIHIHALNYLTFNNDVIVDKDILVLGRQEMQVSLAEFKLFQSQRINKSYSFLKFKYCENLFREHFGARSVTTLDISDYENPTLMLDLSKDLPAELFEKYDTVIDIGCTEHIYDVGKVYQNLTCLVKLGGHIIHIVPANSQCGHGFYQFSPEFIFSTYGAERYDIRDMKIAKLIDPFHWYHVKKQSPGERINIQGPEQLELMATIQKRSADTVIFDNIFQSDYKTQWSEKCMKPSDDERDILGEYVFLKSQSWIYNFVRRFRVIKNKLETHLIHNYPTLETQPNIFKKMNVRDLLN